MLVQQALTLHDARRHDTSAASSPSELTCVKPAQEDAHAHQLWYVRFSLYNYKELYYYKIILLFDDFLFIDYVPYITLVHNI